MMQPPSVSWPAPCWVVSTTTTRRKTGTRASHCAVPSSPISIVMDLNMPVKDGLAALAELKSQRRHPARSGHHLDLGKRSRAASPL